MIETLCVARLERGEATGRETKGERRRGGRGRMICADKKRRRESGAETVKTAALSLAAMKEEDGEGETLRVSPAVRLRPIRTSAA